MYCSNWRTNIQCSVTLSWLWHGIILKSFNIGCPLRILGFPIKCRGVLYIKLKVKNFLEVFLFKIGGDFSFFGQNCQKSFKGISLCNGDEKFVMEFTSTEGSSIDHSNSISHCVRRLQQVVPYGPCWSSESYPCVQNLGPFTIMLPQPKLGALFVKHVPTMRHVPGAIFSVA